MSASDLMSFLYLKLLETALGAQGAFLSSRLGVILPGSPLPAVPQISISMPSPLLACF